MVLLMDQPKLEDKAKHKSFTFFHLGLECTNKVIFLFYYYFFPIKLHAYIKNCFDEIMS